MWSAVILAALGVLAGVGLGEHWYREGERLRRDAEHEVYRAVLSAVTRARINEFSRPGYRWRQVIEADADYGDAVRILDELGSTADRVLP